MRASRASGAGDLGPLLRGERAVAERHPGEMADRQGIHQRPVAGAEAWAAVAGVLAADQHVLGNGEVREELRLLVDDGNRGPAFERRPRRAATGDRPLVGRLLAGEDAHERRFAGAVRTGDAENLAGDQIEIEAGERDGPAIALLQAADDQRVRGGSARPPRSCRPVRPQPRHRHVERDGADGDEAEEELLHMRARG